MEYINLDYINTIADGNDELLKELSEIFITQVNEIMEILNEAIEQENTETLKQAAHKIKSSLRTFGVKKLADKFEEVELNNNITFDGEFISGIQDMIIEVNNVVSELERYLSQHK